MTFLCFRVVIIEYSLNNGITFIKENIKVTSLNCVSAEVGLQPSAWAFQIASTGGKRGGRGAMGRSK